MRRFSITVNGIPYTVDVQEEAVGSSAPQYAPAPRAMPAFPQQPAPAEATPAAAPAAPQTLAAEVAAGDTVVKAPMPGTVTKLVAKVGQTVQKGDVIVMLEAMKMQNEIGSPAAGVLKSLNVAQGDSVKPGQILAVISA